MEINKHFTITYYAKKHKSIFQEMQSGLNYAEVLQAKNGNNCITYFDIDANNYRTATGNYKIRFLVDMDLIIMYNPINNKQKGKK